MFTTFNSCDAEPGALADYILALLKHNAPEADLRQELSSQLEEFLEKGTCLHATFYPPEYLTLTWINAILRNTTIYRNSIHRYSNKILYALRRVVSSEKSLRTLSYTIR